MSPKPTRFSPKGELWCQQLLAQAMKPMRQHLRKLPFLHITLCSFQAPLRRVRSEDWNTGSHEFWTEVEEPHLDNGFCASACSDGEQLSDGDNDLLKDVFMPKKKMNTFWKSKRKTKSYWQSRRMRRSSLLAERKLKAVSLENSLVPTPSWRQMDMTIRVFIVVAMVVKMRCPARDLNPIYLNVVHLDYTLSCVRQMLPRLKYSEKLTCVQHFRLGLQKKMKAMMTSIFRTTLHCFALPVKMMFFYPFLIAGDAQHAK